MKMYRKKSIIEAFKFGIEEIPDWAKEKLITDEEGNTIIKTLEGDLRVREGDYIIKGIKGEIYPCRNDIFEESYINIEEETMWNKEEQYITYDKDNKLIGTKIFLNGKLDLSEDIFYDYEKVDGKKIVKSESSYIDGILKGLRIYNNKSELIYDISDNKLINYSYPDKNTKIKSCGKHKTICKYDGTDLISKTVNFPDGTTNITTYEKNDNKIIKTTINGNNEVLEKILSEIEEDKDKSFKKIKNYDITDSTKKTFISCEIQNKNMISINDFIDNKVYITIKDSNYNVLLEICINNLTNAIINYRENSYDKKGNRIYSKFIYKE